MRAYEKFMPTERGPREIIICRPEMPAILPNRSPASRPRFRRPIEGILRPVEASSRRLLRPSYPRW